MSYNVPAHTSKVGYYVSSRTYKYYWGPKSQAFGNLSQVVTRTPIVAVSNRAPLVKADRLHATNYHRKVGRIDSLASPRVTTSSHKYEAESSIGYRGMDLAMDPHGSAYANPATTVPQWMTDKVIQQCVSDLNGLRALILEDFVDVSRTVNMASGFFATIIRLYLMARRGQWRKMRKLLRTFGHNTPRKIANGWLAFFYGIKPLIGSIRAVLASYAPKQGTYRVTHKVITPVDPNGFVVGNSVTSNGKAFQRAKCGLTVQMSMDSTVANWHALGLLDDPTDALVLFWAITPYSFVVDWILPVERWLSTRRWNSGIVQQAGYVARSLVCDAICIVENPMTGTNNSGAKPIVQVRCMQFTRSAYNNWIPPNGLTLDWSVNLTQSLSALALMAQRS